jgi:hypothetical protein
MTELHVTTGELMLKVSPTSVQRWRLTSQHQLIPEGMTPAQYVTRDYDQYMSRLSVAFDQIEPNITNPYLNNDPFAILNVETNLGRTTRAHPMGVYATRSVVVEYVDTTFTLIIPLVPGDDGDNNSV